MKIKTHASHLKRFKWMGTTFIALALFFAGGAYLFPTVAPEGFYDWVYLTTEEKESFYMVSAIFLVASVYCFRKK